MTRSVVQQLVQRATSDAAFRRQLREEPQTALRGFDLTPDERSALTSADSGRLSAMGVDVRMSKAFAAGSLEATKSSFGDLGPSAASAAITSHLQRVENDINPLTTASSESDALIAGSPSHLQIVEGSLDTGASSIDAGSGVPTHLQMIEGALDTSGSSVVGDSQPDDRLYYAGGTTNVPQAADDAANTGAHLQRLERDLDLGAGGGPTAFEDHSGFTPTLESGTVDDGSGSVTPSDPSINWGDATPTDQ